MYIECRTGWERKGKDRGIFFFSIWVYLTGIPVGKGLWRKLIICSCRAWVWCSVYAQGYKQKWLISAHVPDFSSLPDTTSKLPKVLYPLGIDFPSLFSLWSMSSCYFPACVCAEAVWVRPPTLHSPREGQRLHSSIRYLFTPPSSPFRLTSLSFRFYL